MPFDGLLLLDLVAEGQCQHRLHRLPQAVHGGKAAVGKRAVRGHAGRHQRVRHLQQDGARPGQQHHALGVDALRYHASTLMPPTTRRAFLATCGTAAGAVLAPRWLDAAPALRVTGFELLPVRATERTVWLIVRLRTDAGLTGLGEASDAFGFANTTREDAARMEAELRGLFELVKGRSPLDIGGVSPARAAPRVEGGWCRPRRSAPSNRRCGTWPGRRSTCRVRALRRRGARPAARVRQRQSRDQSAHARQASPAAARAAVRDGFRAVKAAPWDGFPPAGSPRRAHRGRGPGRHRATRAMRDGGRPGVELMVDCHSFFDVALATRVAARTRAVKLAWYEEPVAPERLEETLAIRDASCSRWRAVRCCSAWPASRR